MSGPLQGLRVIELAGLGPAPFCGMMLADLGAEVIRVDRAGAVTGRHDAQTRFDLMSRGRRSIGVDLKHPDGAEVVLRLVEVSAAIFEGFRPGVAERLGVGPDACLARNPALVYGRMTGWGQEGPLAERAGHDIDYIAVAGALHAIGPADGPPVPPLNLVGDFGGGGMLLAVGMLAALLHAAATGQGQVVDAAMVDGAALLTTAVHGALAGSFWADRRRSNLLDGGAPFYTSYETADGKAVAVGALEPQFYAELIAGLGLDGEGLPPQMDRRGWPGLRRRFAEVFATRTREEWTSAFEGTDACVAPVLSLTEAPHHPQLQARETFVEVEGISQPAPAPRFSVTPLDPPGSPSLPGRQTGEVLAGLLGLDAEEISKLRESGAVA